MATDSRHGCSDRAAAPNRRRRALLWTGAFAIGCLGALSALGAGDEEYALRGVEAQPVSSIAARLEAAGEKTRLSFDLSAPVPATAHPVAGPNRIIVDLPEVAFRIDPATGRVPAAGLVKSYRFGHFAPGRSRVVIDLAKPAKILRAASEPAPGGARLVIELAATDPSSFAAAAIEYARAAPKAPEPPPVAVKPADEASDKPLVAIDPGHGGVDIGATGRHGEQEKTIVFEFARALKDKIEAGGRLRAVMTRNEDVFVSLSERVRIARAHNASLFLSIHADTLAEPNVEGATVYTLSAKASDAEAAKIAEKENFADQAAGLERKEEAEEIGDILLDLARRETRAYSRRFSQALITRWKEAGSLNKNPNRSAGFVVLKAYDVPSVLLELGYLSSEKDLSRLTSPEWRAQAAEKTALAVEAYFVERRQAASAPTPTAAAASRPQ